LGDFFLGGRFRQLDRERQHQPGIGKRLPVLVGPPVPHKSSLASHAAPATRSAGRTVPRAREQQLQVIVELGHRADRGARAAHRVRLVDRDGRRDTIHLVDLGPSMRSRNWRA
jgi:hypothetical protein